MSYTFSYLNFLDVFMFIYVYLGAKLLNQAQLDEAVSELQVNMFKIYPLIFVLFSPFLIVKILIIIIPFWRFNYIN